MSFVQVVPVMAVADAGVNNIDLKTPALGQAVMAASTPVVLASNQSAVPVSGPLTDAELRATPVPISGSLALSGSVAVSNFPASQAVTGTFFQSTQPISAVSLPLPTSAATSAKQDTGNTSVNNIDLKTPALGQAAMASSSPVVIASNQSAVPVSGTFWQATQPVSGSVSVSNFPASQAVTGTFWQTTQPVSGTVTATGPLTDTQLRATAVPVSGTFFQATQPVSGSVSVSNFPASQAVTGTFFQATQPISGSVSVSNFPSSQAVTGTFWQATQPVSGPLTDTQLRATPVPVSGPLTDTQLRASAVPVSVPTLTKGTQNATGLSTQDLKDSGRNQTNYFMAAQIVSTATDALMSLTGYKAGAAVVATTTPAVVTSGKTYRITMITLTYVTIVTTPGAVRFTLRANLSGVVAIGSPAVMSWTVGEPTGIAPVAGKFNTVSFSAPDGMEFAAGTGVGISMIGVGATGTAAVVGYGIAGLCGFEY